MHVVPDAAAIFSGIVVPKYHWGLVFHYLADCNWNQVQSCLVCQIRVSGASNVEIPQVHALKAPGLCVADQPLANELRFTVGVNRPTFGLLGHFLNIGHPVGGS